MQTFDINKAVSAKVRVDMKEFTVVLLRPEYLYSDTKTPYGLDVYVANIEVPDFFTIDQIIETAQIEVYQADEKDGMVVMNHKHYKLCVMFEGKHEPKLFGWQV